MGLVPRSSSRMPLRNIAWALLLLLFATGRLGVSANNYTVGDDYGWRRPPRAKPSLFLQWAAKYEFYLGDQLLFDSMGTNSMGTNSTVLQVSQASYGVCDTSDPGGNYTYKTPVTASFAESGTYFFTSSVPGDCEAGLKLAVDIQPQQSGGIGSPPPPGPPLALPPSTRTPSPPPVASPQPPLEVPTGPENVFEVGGVEFGWKAPPSLQFYNDWADKYSPFYVETDRLGFVYDKSIHDVIVLNKAAYDTCNTTANQTYSTGRDIFGVDAPGFYYFASGGAGDCATGMRFQVKYVAGARQGPIAEAPAGGGGGGGAQSPSSPTPAVRPLPPASHGAPTPLASPTPELVALPPLAPPPVPVLAPPSGKNPPSSPVTIPPGSIQPVLPALAPAPSNARLGAGIGTLPLLAALGFSLLFLG